MLAFGIIFKMLRRWIQIRIQKPDPYDGLTQNFPEITGIILDYTHLHSLPLAGGENWLITKKVKKAKGKREKRERKRRMRRI